MVQQSKPLAFSLEPRSISILADMARTLLEAAIATPGDDNTMRVMVAIRVLRVHLFQLSLHGDRWRDVVADYGGAGDDGDGGAWESKEDSPDMERDSKEQEVSVQDCPTACVCEQPVLTASRPNIGSTPGAWGCWRCSRCHGESLC